MYLKAGEQLTLRELLYGLLLASGNDAAVAVAGACAGDVETFVGWMNEKEMLDYTAIAQSSPGAIAVNAAILVGYNLGGVLGALVAIVGTVLPPLVILTAISYVYSAFMSITAIQYIMLGMQAGVVAVICDVVWGLTQSIWKENRYVAVVVALLAFGATAIFSVNVMLVVVLCALFGAAMYGRGEKK